MIQKLIEGWWLLAACSILDAIIAVIYLITQDGVLTFHAWHGTLIFLGKLTLAAGICTIAAGAWNFGKGKSWLLVLNGLACSALGATFAYWTGPLAFRTVALLISAMAVSIGMYELASARNTRGVADEGLFRAFGVASFGFAVAFLAFVFRWMRLEPGAPTQSLHWLGAYFGFSAICMLVLSLRQRRPGVPISGGWQAQRA